MKAISLWQPWASLIACGDKPFETRHWPPPRELIGQRIGIHAAKKVDREAVGLVEDLIYGQHHAGGFELADRLAKTFDRCPDALMGVFGNAAMPAGAVVCTVLLIGAYQCGEPIKDGLVKIARRREMPEIAHIDPGGIPTDDFGDYAPGRWAWRVTDVQIVNPPAAVIGRQGFFDLPQGWLA